MGLKEYALNKKVQEFLIEAKRLALGQHRLFDDKYVGMIRAYYREYLSSLETQKTYADEIRTADMYDLYNYYKSEFEETYHKHCNSYLKIKKAKDLTEEQRIQVDEAHSEVKSKYTAYVASLTPTATKQTDGKNTQ